MTPMLQILLIFLCAETVLSEVRANFDKCKGDFFYKGTPPVVSYPQDLKEKSICQWYKNRYHYATLYSERYRIPVYSAYTLPIQICHRSERRASWFIEPQVRNHRCLAFPNNVGL